MEDTACQLLGLIDDLLCQDITGSEDVSLFTESATRDMTSGHQNYPPTSQETTWNGWSNHGYEEPSSYYSAPEQVPPEQVSPSPYQQQQQYTTLMPAVIDISPTTPNVHPEFQNTPPEALKPEQAYMSEQLSVKEHVRLKIQKKRSDIGQPMIKTERRSPAPHNLTNADLKRRERRRESNRRAAQKCREKKKIKADSMADDMRRLEFENNELRVEVLNIQAERNKLAEIMRRHLQHCQFKQPAEQFTAHDTDIPPHQEEDQASQRSSELSVFDESFLQLLNDLN